MTTSMDLPHSPCLRRRLDIAKLGQVSESALSKLSTLTALTALKLGMNPWGLYRLSGRCFLMFNRFVQLRVLHLGACLFLQSDAYLAIATACPRLECLHFDSARNISLQAFQATRMYAHLLPFTLPLDQSVLAREGGGGRLSSANVSSTLYISIHNGKAEMYAC
jgi:hypothetical protein